jgi:HSP20 family protein
LALTPNDPFKKLSNFVCDYDKDFSDLPYEFGIEHNHFGYVRVDIHETESEVVATCNIPGLEKKEDVNIEIENNTLNISGSINNTNEVKQENIHRKERYTGSFQKSISLPTQVSEEGARATYKNGVLEVSMPKLTQYNKKNIDVEFH